MAMDLEALLNRRSGAKKRPAAVAAPPAAKRGCHENMIDLDPDHPDIENLLDNEVEKEPPCRESHDQQFLGLNFLILMISGVVGFLNIFQEQIQSISTLLLGSGILHWHLFQIQPATDLWGLSLRKPIKAYENYF